MQLGRAHSGDLQDARDVATALRLAAAVRGHRPALTVLGAGPEGRRDEQSFASLAQWAAKGAHLLEVDLDLGPGDLLHLDAPAGWLPAAVCLAAWWVGAAVTDDPAAAVASVVHEDRPGPGHLDVFRIGDAVDGTPLAATQDPVWAIEVQAFPDQPPTARAAADLLALRSSGVDVAQSALLDQARSVPPGRLGIDRDLDLRGAVTWLATRPAATGQPTVLVSSADRTAAHGERVTHWLGD